MERGTAALLKTESSASCCLSQNFDPTWPPIRRATNGILDRFELARKPQKSFRFATNRGSDVWSKEISFSARSKGAGEMRQPMFENYMNTIPETREVSRIR